MSEDDRPATQGQLSKLGTVLRGEMAQMGADLRCEMAAMEKRLVLQIADSAQRTLDVMDRRMAAMETRLEERLVDRLGRWLGEEMKRHFAAFTEQMLVHFRVQAEQAQAQADRLAVQERLLAEHLADTSVHVRKRTRRARR